MSGQPFTKHLESILSRERWRRRVCGWSNLLSMRCACYFVLNIAALDEWTFGISAADADAIVERAVPEASNGVTAPICDLQKLFRELRSLGCKTALCTADSRAATEHQMHVLGIATLLDIIVCGNDDGIIPKPSPHCAIQICKRLDVPLKQTIMVGDTIVDLKMGRVAGLRCTVGVLTGVGNRDTLGEYTDYFLDNVSELPLLISKTINHCTKRG
ncbi:hypothetical protein KIN20_005361 [Parelaphostrongylus tenuis]|uniref:Uncharacterized protein n=1 Tax=Parelaphostrongylus tenuis TaxID=148309 RepID=A0AAD5M4E4_PARTN|nr:hypothetical protein KIN20_005361 [Parelaphostrongylus tenuis]